MDVENATLSLGQSLRVVFSTLFSCVPPHSLWNEESVTPCYSRPRMGYLLRLHKSRREQTPHAGLIRPSMFTKHPLVKLDTRKIPHVRSDGFHKIT